MTIDLIRELSRDNVLIVDPESKLSAFIEEEDFTSYHVDQVRWIPTVLSSDIQ